MLGLCIALGALLISVVIEGGHLGALVNVPAAIIVFGGTFGATVICNRLEDILKLDPTALVVMTSGFSRDYVRTYLERGTWGFLQKPIDRDQLLGVVRRALDQGFKISQKSTGT